MCHWHRVVCFFAVSSLEAVFGVQANPLWMLVLKYSFFAWIMLAPVILFDDDRERDLLVTFLFTGSRIVALILIAVNSHDDYFSTRTPWLDVRRGASCRGLKIDGSPRQRKPGLL